MLPKPLLQRANTIDGSSTVTRPVTRASLLKPLTLQRASTIDGSGITCISRPATRRMRTLAINAGGCRAGDLVYVGPNPVIKKTTNMLRKIPSLTSSRKKQQHQPKQQQQKQMKTIPKRASKTSLKPTTRGRSRSKGSLTNDNCSDIPKAPRRKASNPFLRNGLVGQDQCTTTTTTRTDHEPITSFVSFSRSLSPVNTRSMSRQKLQARLSLDGPLAPCRKASIPDDMANKDTSTHHHHAAPTMPNRKASNPFLRNGLVAPHNSIPILLNEPIMTRSKSRQKIQARLSLEIAPQVPCRKDSIQDAMSIQMTEASSPPIMPHRKVSHTNLLHKSRQKVSFMDLEWNKMSLRDPATTTTTTSRMAPPIFPMRKASDMELNAFTN